MHDFSTKQVTFSSCTRSGLNGKTSAANAAYQPQKQDTDKTQRQPLTNQ